MNFSPYPKNPVVSKFFRQIGRAEELGSGIRNMFKYVSHYTPRKSPDFFEGDIFKAFIPVPVPQVPESKDQSLKKRGKPELGESGVKITANQQGILKLISEDKDVSIVEIADRMEIATSTVENNIIKLKEKDLLERVGPCPWRLLENKYEC